MAVHDIHMDAIRARPGSLFHLRAQTGEIGRENRRGDLHALAAFPSNVRTNSRYRPSIALTACSRVIFFARHATSGSQKLVRPTAKPMNPGTPAATVSHS